MKNEKSKLNTGFAMLFAVLTSSLLVSIGISIFSISLKELMIATSAQDSQKAYYAADSAQECALYWDLKVASFPTCIGSGNPCPISTTTPTTITCNGNPVAIPTFDGSSYIYKYENPSLFKYGVITDPDAGITITKEYIPALDIIQTTIVAQGHNTGILGRRVERGISQAFNN